MPLFGGQGRGRGRGVPGSYRKLASSQERAPKAPPWLEMKRSSDLSLLLAPSNLASEIAVQTRSFPAFPNAFTLFTFLPSVVVLCCFDALQKIKECF